MIKKKCIARSPPFIFQRAACLPAARRLAINLGSERGDFALLPAGFCSDACIYTFRPLRSLNQPDAPLKKLRPESDFAIKIAPDLRGLLLYCKWNCSKSNINKKNASVSHLAKYRFFYISRLKNNKFSLKLKCTLIVMRIGCSILYIKFRAAHDQ